MPRAFYTDHPWADVEVERKIVADADCVIEVSPNNREETLATLVGDAHTIITCWAPVTARVIDAAPACRHIARTGIGLDNIDVPHATRRGIVVTNVPDYCLQEVAEHALAMIYSLGRKIAQGHHDTKRGVYNLVQTLPVERIAGKTLGIVGLGRTGTLLAKLATAVGMQVVATNRSHKTPAGVAWQSLDRLLSQSDYVSLHCPLTEATHHLINPTTLALMKPSAFLINTSRGGLIDHGALAAALDAGQLAGAALDVQDTEPPDLETAPYNDPRVIITPHTAFCSTEAILELRRRVAHQVVAVLNGDRPENIVNGL
ncbi:C-terminal binding protein [Botrimarina hoheduenensis]|uniref:Putative 2-hydroxyacid dehydrogenase n=1 Tax=Botrimarina hoheduenensis TaxID=2528000 RepID=A0A5C5WBG9_9BACT|nr:C-terminal binding protein [Botrimarina hoheduenensis]TWT47455.1 putative 2-hydroxyacid dehydrogenase [Botrimarina hoheduenensis]